MRAKFDRQDMGVFNYTWADGTNKRLAVEVDPVKVGRFLSRHFKRGAKQRKALGGAVLVTEMKV